MWMMGYTECGGEFTMPDSFAGRKLRPLVPRPNNTSNLLSGSDFISLNHRLASVMDQTGREFNVQPVVVSSRWNPTPEQLRTLEELYRRGTRTPTAEQIQQITAQLRRYGKIEGKNVFYWFQNHKARERLKRRRRMESFSDHDQHGRDVDILERKESGVNKTTAYEVDHTKICLPSSNCTALSQEAAGSMSHHHHRRSFMERNATWQMMQLSSSPPTYHHLIPSSPKLIKSSHGQCFNIFIAPYVEDGYGDGCGGASQTLPLFPVRSCGGDGDDGVNEKETNPAMNANFTTPYQFFEFLPLKN